MKMIIITMAMGAALLISADVKSQVRVRDSAGMVSRQAEEAYIQDSTELAEARKLQRRNTERMADAKDEQLQTQTKAKESQRVSDEADDAAKQSRQAVRAEKRAQKFRKKADRQAQKAEDARIKSDGND